MCIQRRATGIIGHSMSVSPTTHMMSPPDVEVGDVGRAPGPVGGEVGGEQLVGRAGQRQPGEGVDRDGHEEVEELQRRVEPVRVGIVPEDLPPEQVAHEQEDQVLRVVHALLRERVVVPDRQVADRDDDGVEDERHDRVAEELGHAWSATPR